MRKWQVKRGDTLVEVMFSVAVFGLVAIGVVTLMNSSLAATQSSLENTMVRTEIDAQAEALRFIHDAYASQRNQDTGSQVYKGIWEKITKDYVTKPENVPSFNFTSCDTAYDPNNAQSLFKTYSFAINTRKLDPSTVKSNNINDIIVPAKTGASTYNTNVFTVPSLYPRIVYTGSGASNSETDLLEKFDDGGTVYTKANLVEGVWVIAVCGDNTDNCNGNNSVKKQPSYYDFYIRSCWYAPGKNTATTLGTIMRLYNPNVEVTHYTESTFSLSYDANGGAVSTPLPEPKVVSGVGDYTFDVTNIVPTKKDAEGNTVTFLGWCTGKIDATGKCNGSLIQSGTTVRATAGSGKDVLLTASYGYQFSLTYDKNTTDSVTKMPSPNPYKDTCITPSCSITFDFSSSIPLREGYIFIGWSENKNATNATYTPGAKNITMSFTAVNNNRTVYAIWYKTSNSDWAISLYWDNNAPTDLDSHTLAGGTEYYYNHKNGTSNGISVGLDHDNTSHGGNGTDPEITSIDNLGSKTVYFWVYSWSGESISGSSARVLISSKTGEFATITPPSSGSGRYWNVAKISNGKITVRNTITSSPETSY